MDKPLTETNRIEFKRELSDDLDLEKEVVAFLNYREGGIIYVGIDKFGNAVGAADLDGDMLKIKDRIRKNILPSPMGLFDVTVATIDDIKVIKVFVASGSEKPYYKAKYGMTTKGCFVRVGTAAEPMSNAMIEDLFAHRVRNSIGHIKSPRQDLTFRQLRIYYEEKKRPLGDDFFKTLELLDDVGNLNYVAYLVADENGMPLKFAKYAGTDRMTLISNNDFGYCSLITATNKLIDKLEVENYVNIQLTPKTRIDTPLWDDQAVKEAVINAIVHNDYTREVPPKFELFSDRLEITSAGTLPENLTKEEFFNGISVPRNKELMRIFHDVNLVESLESGMRRIMESYDRSCFVFMEHFTRITIPFYKQKLPITTQATTQATPQATPQVTPQVESLLIALKKGEFTRKELMEKLNINDLKYFKTEFLQPALHNGLIELVNPDKPNHPRQKYRRVKK